MKLVGYKKGVVHLLPLLLIGALVVAFWLLAAKFVFKKKLPFLDKKDPTVQVKSEYKNPFNKSSQYVNPFDQSKSPFLNLK